MIKVIFHKSLLPYTEGNKEINVERDSYLFITLNCLNLFPKLEKVAKQHINNSKEDLALIVNGKIIDIDRVFSLPEHSDTIHIVPIFYGGDPASSLAFLVSFAFNTVFSLVQGYDLGQALVRGAIGGAFAAAGAYIGGAIFGPAAGAKATTGQALGQAVVSGVFMVLSNFVANAVTGPPPKDNTLDNSSRQQNDPFGSIENTTGQDAAIPLNYGMLRVGGHYLSMNIETATDQRLSDPEVSESNLLDYSGLSGGNNDGYGSFGLDRDFASIAGQLGDAPTPTGTSGLTPDQY